MHKRFLCLLLCTLCLTACSSQEEKLEVIEPTPPVVEDTVDEQAPAAEEAPAAPSIVTIPSEEVTYTVALKSYREEIFSADDAGLMLACCEYFVPHMSASNDTDDAITDAFNAGFVHWENGDNFAEIASWAEEHYDTFPDFFGANGPYYTDELTSSVYQQGNLVSISSSYYSFTGGAHGNTVFMSWLFDTNTGTFITPLSLATDSQATLDGITALLLAQADDVTGQYGLTPAEMYWENYEEVLSDWPSYGVSFDETGMWVMFSPYELAAYAAGPQQFCLTYDQLEGFFPAQTLSLLCGEEIAL